MTDRPIIFSAPMVRALLDGRKTQTRRVLKEQPPADTGKRIARVQRRPIDSPPFYAFEWRSKYGNYLSDAEVRFAVGDRLWVREASRVVEGGIVYDGAGNTEERVDPYVEYRANQKHPEHGRWRPSIHMPRWASRLTLTVTDVRVERLQDISTDDVLAEGAPIDPDYRCITMDESGPPMVAIGTAQWQSPRAWYHGLWDTLHGPGSWEANPWVVALTFTVEQRNIDAR